MKYNYGKKRSVGLWAIYTDQVKGLHFIDNNGGCWG